MEKLKTKIFTFWEPSDKLPAYLNLCMSTWKKFLPEYEIVLLDYSSLSKWLGEDYYDKILYTKLFSLPKQADAIRCALLKKYGGLWLDADTIITSPKVKEMLNVNSEFVLVDKHLGVISAKPDSFILNEWDKGIKKSIRNHKIFCKNKFVYILSCIFCPFIARTLKRWHCLGNAILDKYIETSAPEKCFSINRYTNYILPELNYAKENNINLTCEKERKAQYTKFYFEENNLDYILQNNKCGLIELHNSRMPRKFREMSEEEFLSQNNTMANLLKESLKR